VLVFAFTYSLWNLTYRKLLVGLTLENGRR
jgi:hypothetical protein